MITRSTVLVLGAGASQEFGFPSGRELLLNVCNGLQTETYVMFRCLLDLGHSPLHITTFREHLYLSMQPSIDAFLELRPEFTDVGKAAIACGLIPCEREEQLYRNPNHPSWYEYLFNRLATSLDSFRRNRLSILTFNYDRSLEHFLFLALKNSYGLTERDAADTLKTIEIVHLQGELGDLPYMSRGPGRPYNSNPDVHSVKIATSAIKVVHENVERDPAFSRAHKLLADAEMVGFLGFAYHPINMARLGCRERFRAGQTYVGTAYGIAEGERPVILRSLPNTVVLGYQTEDIMAFIRRDAFLSIATKPER